MCRPVAVRLVAGVWSAASSGGMAGVPGSCRSCSANEPRSPRRTARAAASINVRPSSGTAPAGRTNTPPGLPSRGAGRAALQIAPQSVSGLAGPLVEDDEVEVQATATDIGVPLHELAGQRIVIGGPESGQHDRPVAGDGERPEARLSQPVGGDGVRRTQGRTRKEHGRRQAVDTMPRRRPSGRGPAAPPGSGRERLRRHALRRRVV